jgi:hypothetical protein
MQAGYGLDTYGITTRFSSENTGEASGTRAHCWLIEDMARFSANPALRRTTSRLLAMTSNKHNRHADKSAGQQRAGSWFGYKRPANSVVTYAKAGIRIANNCAIVVDTSGNRFDKLGP